ncbi:MAG: oxygen-independent coproporphyrinogen III oxidase [Calditrichia bacterium]
MKSAKFEVDIELIKKYDRPGPRYTSYPTAPHFHDKFGPKEYLAEIERSNEAENPADLSLYFHIPFCPSLCLYCACNTIITHNKGKIADYLEDLHREIDRVGGLIKSGRRVIQLHWGGGTPTYLTVEQIERLFGHIKERFELSENAEVSIEIDPRQLTPEHLPALSKLGFNRVSFGVQDFDPDVQEAIHRIQPEEMAHRVVSQSRDLGFDSVNVDLIYGLPHQTVDSYRRTLDKILKLDPDRLAVFNFAHVPWLKKHQKAINPQTLPGPEEKLKILKMVIETLTENGYVFIGMDHFAKPEDELSRALKDHTLYRNFQGYTTKAGAEVFAMGITSISQLKTAYAQNSRELGQYKEKLQRGELPTVVGIRLDEDDQLRREVITELMCNNRVLKTRFEEKYGIRFDEYFAESLGQLDEFIADGLMVNEADRIQVSEPGRLIIRNIAMAFDKYLKEDQKRDRPIYSRTV